MNKNDIQRECKPHKIISQLQNGLKIALLSKIIISTLLDQNPRCDVSFYVWLLLHVG